MGMTSRKNSTKKPSETLLSNPTATVSQNLIPIWAAQCANCRKWRIVPSQDEYEDIRSSVTNDPFVCNKSPNVTCDDPEDILFDGSYMWVFDQPDIPKTPVGFKRNLAIRNDCSTVNVYYISPTGKRLRTASEVTAFLNANPHEFNDLSISDFNFAPVEVRRA